MDTCFDSEVFPLAALGLLAGLVFVACSTALWSIPLPMGVFYAVLAVCLLAVVPIRSWRNGFILLAGAVIAQLAWVVPLLYWSWELRNYSGS